MTEQTQTTQESADVAQEKAPEVAAAEVAQKPEASQADAAAVQEALQKAADEEDNDAPEVEVVRDHRRGHNPNALRGIPAGPAPHPRTR